MRSRVFDFIAIVVTLIWSASFVASVLKTGYDTPPLMHTLMTAVIGAYAGGKILFKTGEKNDR